MTPARCEKCGHEGALPPDDPLTGAKRFECPICGEPALTPVDVAATPPPRPPSRWGAQLAGEPIATLYRPEAPRPEGFGGTIADLGALLHTTVAVVRAGFGTALRSFLILAPFAGLVAWFTCWAGFQGGPPGVVVALVGVVVSFSLLWAAPLAAFAGVALGGRPTLREVLGRALERAPLLALTIAGSLAALFAALLASGALLKVLTSGIHARTGTENFDIVITLLLGGCGTLVFHAGFIWLDLHGLLLTHVLSVAAEPGQEWHALARVWRLSRGRAVMLAVVAAFPVLIQVVSTPTPFARELIERSLGADAATAIAIAIAVIGWTVAVLLGSAMLAAALAVILATPIEESR